jgi:hypothetical protein
MIEGLMIRIKRVYETPSMEDRVKPSRSANFYLGVRLLSKYSIPEILHS